MKKILFFTLVSMFFLASCGQQEVVDQSASVSLPIEQAKQEIVEENKTVLAANFELYNEGSLGEAENTVLFFHAGWCPSCVAANSNIIESGVSDDTKILRVDFDTQTELRQKYGVTSQHTFVQVDANGDMIKKWNGSNSADDIQEQLNTEAMMEKEEVMQEDTMEKTEDVMMDKEDDKMMEEETMEKDETVMEDKMEKEPEVMEAKTEEVAAPAVALAGSYANYDSGLVGSTEKTVLFFHAAWCPSCVSADKNITSANVPDGLTVLKADFDSSTDLRQKYGVTSQHTFVQVDADGNMINKWTGGNSIDDIVEKL